MDACSPGLVDFPVIITCLQIILNGSFASDIQLISMRYLSETNRPHVFLYKQCERVNPVTEGEWRATSIIKSIHQQQGDDGPGGLM